MNGPSQNQLPAGTSPRIAGAIALGLLALGILIGYLFHKSAATGTAASAPASGPQLTASDSSANSIQPLLARLRNDPKNPELLEEIGNVYYDQHDYEKAINYYQKYLDLRPQDAAVRTDMGTAMWYGGNPDGALSQYQIALRFQADYPNTLFNMGIVKWQGKQDREGALQAWQTLLAKYPEYQDRQKVEELIKKVQAESKS